MQEKNGYKTVGIIGGMGPLATADLLQKITLHTQANSDQEHLHVYIDSNVAIADRTQALLYGGEDPTEEMIKSAKRLISLGADFLLLACHTAHGFYERIQCESSVPILNMIEVTRDELLRRGIRCAGLMATDGTLRTDLYQRCFGDCGIRLISPAGERQEVVMRLIYNGVKANNLQYDAADFMRVVESLYEEGAQTILLACTELPPAIPLYRLNFAYIDPTLELAKAAIRYAGATVKE